MPPQLATLVCVAGIAALFWMDRKKPDGVSRAVWIPLIWMFFAGSRFASQWLSLGAPDAYSYISRDEGSPLDRNVFLALIIAAAWVLKKREQDWAGLMRRNVWLTLFFAFAAISVVWADDPVIAFKRWVKFLGTLFMALIIATEQRPDEALGFIVRRLTYVLIPLSVLFIKFYPDIGRAYHMGFPMFTGVTTQKNSLGQLCLYLVIYVAWVLLYKREPGRNRSGNEFATPLLLVAPLLAWVLYMSQSATSIALAAFSVSLLVVLRFRLFRRVPRRIFAGGTMSALLLGILLATTDIKDTIILWMGRDPGLTDRTSIWAIVLKTAHNPIIGAGYESFWTGSRLHEIWATLGFKDGGIIQAHNGYIELYLNLGVVGVALLVFWVVAGFGSLQKSFRLDYAGGTLRLTLVIVVLIYNYTEAAFQPLNNLFLLLLFSVVQVGTLSKMTPLRSVASSIRTGPRKVAHPHAVNDHETN